MTGSAGVSLINSFDMWRGVGLILLCLVTFTVGLGRSAITDSDEAYYAEAGREMVASGDWTTPHYNFEPRLQKPILFYWLIATTARLTGANEWAARIWSALAGVGLALVAAGVARRWAGPNEGLLAGAIVATSFGVVPIARQALPDVPLAFFVSVTVWAAIEALTPVTELRRSSWRPQHWLYLSAAAAALGFLTKGPVAVALPVTVLTPLLWLAWRRGERRALLSRVRFSHVAMAVAIFVVIGAPWYLAVMRAQGLDYARQFFIGENVERFATSTYNTWRGWQYVPVIIAGLLPWSTFGVLWWKPIRDWFGRRSTMTPAEARLVCWAVGPLAFFMISVGSQPRYILPCLVPISVLLACTVTHVARSPLDVRGRSYRAAAMGSGLMVVVIAGLLWRAASVLVVPGEAPALAGPGVMLGIGVVATLLLVVVPRVTVPAVIAVAAALSLTVFEWSLLAPGRPEPVETMAAAIESAGPDLPVCACGAIGRSLNFYTHHKVEIANVTPENVDEARQFLSTDQRVLAVMDVRGLEVLEASLGRRFPRLAEMHYLNTFVWRRGDTLPDPDPTLVQHVVLISNR